VTEDSEFATERHAGASVLPTSTADDVLELARQLLEQGRNSEALAAIEQYAAGDPIAVPATDSQALFDEGVSDRELEIAFESAESDRDEMLDADEIAERAIRQTDSELQEYDGIPAVKDDFMESGASYATHTVAQLLEDQGAAPTASKVRAIVESSSDAGSAAPVDQLPVRDRRTATIMELERWLVNLRGVAQ
jgi:hypothetical protein